MFAHQYASSLARTRRSQSLCIAAVDNCSDDKVMYKSIDTTTTDDHAVNFPTEFLNSLDLLGVPPHVLNFKAHAPILLLQNLDAP